MTKLSEKIAFFRVDRPSEWLMDEFKRDAEALEQRIKELEQERGRLHQFRAESTMARKILLNKGDDAEDVAPIDLKNALLKRDFKQQAKGVEDARRHNVRQRRKLGSAWGAGHIVQDLQEREKQLRKQAEDL